MREEQLTVIEIIEGDFQTYPEYNHKTGLLACANCLDDNDGGKPRLIKASMYPDLHRIECEDCGFTGPLAAVPLHAKFWWNRTQQADILAYHRRKKPIKTPTQKALDKLGRIINKLDKKDTRIAELEERVRAFEEAEEARTYQDEWRWRHIREWSAEENFGLPVPRLELRWRRTKGGCGLVCDYFLVYRHFLHHIQAIPLGSTKRHGGIRDEPLPLDTPFREGAHIGSDMKELDLRGFVVNTDGKWRELRLDSEGRLENRDVG